MITISTTQSSTGDILLLPNSNGYVMQFRQSDIDNGLVLFRPSLLTNVQSSRQVSMPLTGRDASGNIRSETALFNVQYSFCPYLSLSASPNVTLYTNSTSTPIPITASIVSLTEPHGLNSWDVKWVITAVGTLRGKLEFYCPDNQCEVGWQELMLPASIKHVSHYLLTVTAG